MAIKRATLVVYRSDRNLWNDGTLKCRVFDLFGPSSPRQLLSRTIPPTVELELDLPFDGGNTYGISVDASGHRSGFHVLSRRSFLRADNSGSREIDSTIIRPMLVAADAQSSDLTAAFKAVQALGSPFARYGLERFEALRNRSAKLAFLNIEAKLRETRIGNRSLLSFVRDVREVAVDRVFLFMSAELRPLIEESPDFADAPGHDAPADLPSLPAHPDSWKHTRYGYGNVQLSFSRLATSPASPAMPSELCFSVDCDIDLERDLGHAGEFIINQVFRKTTDQTLVYRMLWDQGVLPAYLLIPPRPVGAGTHLRVGQTPVAAARAGHKAKRRRVARPAARRKTTRKRR